MSRRSAFGCSLSKLPQRANSRHLIYSFLFLLSLCVLYYTGFSRQTFFAVPNSNSPTDTVWKPRAEAVKAAYLHAYHGYEKYAAPHDELLPLSNQSSDDFNAWGVTIVDSLDTMYLMGLTDEFNRGLAFVETMEFWMPPEKFAPYFETVIRYLGGLLSAHALSGNSMLLERADQLAMRMAPVFKTPSGLAKFGVNTATGVTSGPFNGVLAEFATLQLEYSYLAKRTGKSEHYQPVKTLMKVLERANLSKTDGMFPIQWNLNNGAPLDTHISAGARADSAHEYLLKQYLLTGKADKTSLDLYIRATTSIILNLLRLSPERGLLYVTDTIDGEASGVFEHLSCFLPGLLSLGVATLPLDTLATEETRRAFPGFSLKDLHLWAAEGLGQSCWLSYADSKSGLGPDEMRVASNGRLDDHWMSSLHLWKNMGSHGAPPGVGPIKPTNVTRGYDIRADSYLLRPETVESFYYLWKHTGDIKWRERGWDVFQAIERSCKTGSGYASVRKVDESEPDQLEEMPSYFLAETLKYLYLLFLDEDPLPGDQWVFNTEAHPLPIFEWTLGERASFGVS